MPPSRPSTRPKRGAAAAQRDPWEFGLRAALGFLAIAMLALFAAVAIRCGDDAAKPAATASETPDGLPGTPSAQAGNTVAPSPSAEPTAESTPVRPTAEPTRQVITVPCGDILVPLDKSHALPPGCAPGDLVSLPADMSYQVDLPIVLRAEAAAAIRTMFEAAKKDGFELVVRSAYRSYSDQERTFQYWVNAVGLAQAELTSARAGHSEHQLGTAADVTSASAGYGLESFEGTPEARWLEQNCAKYGLVISYPAGKTAITGYAYEPWHVRYVGAAVAAKVASSGLTPVEVLSGR